jgi:hypothetical protein
MLVAIDRDDTGGITLAYRRITMPYCPNCATEVDEEDKFCRKCGTELAREASIVDPGDAGATYKKESLASLKSLEYRSPWYRRLWFGMGLAAGVILICFGLPPSTGLRVAFLTSGVAVLTAMIVWFSSHRERKRKPERN